MAEVYEVSNSFRAKDREGNPKVYESKFGTFDVWKVYFTGDEQGYSINKKQGFEGFQKGQKIYGTKDDWRFKQEQMPGELRGQEPAQSTKVPMGGLEEVNARLDYIEGLVESIVERLNPEEPVDLSSIPF